MTRRTDAHPELDRPDVLAPFFSFSTWRVGSPARQRLSADAIARTWERRPWPSASSPADPRHPPRSRNAGHGRNRSTCGSWSLIWSWNSALTCTLS